MKNLDKSPIAWFVFIVLFGWWAVSSGEFETFVVFTLALILSNLIKILSR